MGLEKHMENIYVISGFWSEQFIDFHFKIKIMR